jgi:hypothetical protein
MSGTILEQLFLASIQPKEGGMMLSDARKFLKNTMGVKLEPGQDARKAAATLHDQLTAYNTSAFNHEGRLYTTVSKIKPPKSPLPKIVRPSLLPIMPSSRPSSSSSSSSGSVGSILPPIISKRPRDVEYF